MGTVDPPFRHKQLYLDLNNQLIVDLFAGGGGVSVGMEMAWGRSPDIAVNHNEAALAMHRMNHPQTRHFIADVFEVDPHGATQDRPVGWLHLSPDCTHHSQASAGQPRNVKIRGLSWVGKRWAAQVRPVCISLENVKQIQHWCPLIAKRDPDTGRVLQKAFIYSKGAKGKIKETLIWRPAEKGEYVPLRDQFLVPDPKRLGKTWRKFVRELEALGYHVEWRIICAADMGGHTTRERLIMMARCDGEPIVWPAPTHFKKPQAGQQKWKPAHECIDFSIPCPSIFERKIPLAKNTNKRIAKGIFKYVLESGDPFIVPIAHYNGSTSAQSVSEPLRTIMAETKGGEFAVAVPSLVAATHHGSDRVSDLKDDPMPTVTAANRGELMVSTPILAKIRGDSHGHTLKDPVPTITSGGNMARDAGAAHALGVVSPILVQTGYGERDGQAPRALDITAPLGTAVAGAVKHAVAAATLVGVGGPEYSGKPADVEAPIGTVMTENHRGVATAYLMQANDGFNTTIGREMTEPVSAVTASGSQQQIVTAHLQRQFGQSVGSAADDPVGTVMADGGGKTALATAFLSSYYTDDANRCRPLDEAAATITTENRIGFVECTLSSDQEAGALKVAAFLIEYYSEGGQWGDLKKPINALTTRERMALVTVHLKGVPYVIVDIGLRMLKPRELYRAQDFPEEYIIDRGADGREFTTTEQVRMVGNSVDPLMVKEIFYQNAPQLAVRKVA